MDTFEGRVMHTSQYRVPSDLVGQRVLVVGTGAASGSDIAQDLAGVAASVTVSVRTERWILHRGMVRRCSSRSEQFPSTYDNVTVTSIDEL